jgi:hypothetical protein
MITTFALGAVLLQIASPPEDPPLLYPMYLLIIGAAAGAAAQRTFFHKRSPWTAILAGIIGSAIGGYFGIAVLGHRNVALAGGLIGALIALVVTGIIKQSKADPEKLPSSPNTTAVGEVIAGPHAAAAQPVLVAEQTESIPHPRHAVSRVPSGDIFISYASVDRPFAQRIATALQAEGWSVWWDRVIPPGKSFDAVIEEALDSAKCVVVLWSSSSVASDWVKVEAAEAARRRILIPALIGTVTIPLEFRRIQAASLSDWDGSSDHPGFESLTTSVRELLGPPH